MKKWIILCLLVLVGCQSEMSKEKGGQVRNGMAYYHAYNDDSISIASVCLEDDTIIGATLDELTHLSKEEYQGLLESDKGNGKKHIASKVENSELYSQMMKNNGATQTIQENFKAICDYVKGKSSAHLQAEIDMKSDKEVTDLVAGCTLENTKGYIQTIINACNQAK